MQEGNCDFHLCMEISLGCCNSVLVHSLHSALSLSCTLSTNVCSTSIFYYSLTPPSCISSIVCPFFSHTLVKYEYSTYCTLTNLGITPPPPLTFHDIRTDTLVLTRQILKHFAEKIFMLVTDRGKKFH
jgi:hypothetical protein